MPRLLHGLPPYGPPALVFPPEWERRGGEGVVVEFESETGSWVGNFEPGLHGLTQVALHPNRRDAIVIAKGDLWVVHAEDRTAERLAPPVLEAFEVSDPDGWIFSCQGIALARFGPSGLLWETRRLSWDGFDQVRVTADVVTGLAWDPARSRWVPFRVDARTGVCEGGSFPPELV